MSELIHSHIKGDINMGQNELGEALAAGLEGYLTGRQLRQQARQQSLADQKAAFELQKLQEESQDRALSRQMFSNYFGGQGQGVARNLPIGSTQFGIRPKSLKFAGQDFEVIDPFEEERKLAFERRKESQSPLTGETASKFAGSKQAIGNVRDILGITGITRDPLTGKVTAPTGLGRKIIGAKALNFSLPLSGSPVNKLVETAVRMFPGTDARRLDLAYNTLAENSLRARTGAAATEPEIQREKQRIFARFSDQPEVILDRLLTTAGYFKELGRQIRPSEPLNYNVPKPGAKLMTDAEGNKAYVYPDGSYEEA